MSSRRQFLGTLGKALGAGGLLLPWAGKGALALPADLGSAARLPVTAAALPFSREGLQLRDLRHEWRACYLGQHDYGGSEAYDRAWRAIVCDRYHPLVKQVVQRPPATWVHCVELAEICWPRIADRRSFHVGRKYPHEGDPTEALVEAVLTLGGGERFDPTDPRAWEARHG